jgi:hypothetical protein
MNYNQLVNYSKGQVASAHFSAKLFFYYYYYGLLKVLISPLSLSTTYLGHNWLRFQSAVSIMSLMMALMS